MIDGFFKIGFISGGTAHYGSGVVILERNLVRGGDASYYYIGEYSVNQDEITINVSTIHYAGPQQNILGNAKRYDMQFKGKVSHQQFEVTGHIINGPGIVHVIVLRIADISREQAFDALISD